jgi:hypothetical protein
VSTQQAKPGDVWEHDGIYYEVTDAPWPERPAGEQGDLWAEGYGKEGNYRISDVAFLECEGRFVSRDTASKEH